MDKAILNLLQTYNELNAAVIDEFNEEPSALEFMRYVAKNRPFIVRGMANEWKATRKWDATNLRQTMSEKEVKVAVTPHGNADAVVEQPDQNLVFVEPHEAFETFENFMDHIQNKGRSESIVKYAQTQNDNLRNEYSALYPDVPEDIPFARIALCKCADAINLWLGDDRSVTSLHKDNYENIYVQIRGQKHFVLLPPVEAPCVNEQNLPRARYSSSTNTEKYMNKPAEILKVEIDEQAGRIPVPIWDPDIPSERATSYSHLSKPLRLTLNQGDMLYLPAMWYHKVSQTAGEEGFVCAVNYWYDMEFSGDFWANHSFLRDVITAEQRQVKYPDLSPTSHCLHEAK